VARGLRKSVADGWPQGVCDVIERCLEIAGHRFSRLAAEGAAGDTDRAAEGFCCRFNSYSQLGYRRRLGRRRLPADEVADLAEQANDLGGLPGGGRPVRCDCGKVSARHAGLDDEAAGLV
jgi:hypothetical protein